MNESIINTNYDLLPGSYLFSTIAQKIKEYQGNHANADIIRLGIGDVTTPLIPEVMVTVPSRATTLCARPLSVANTPPAELKWIPMIFS